MVWGGEERKKRTQRSTWSRGSTWLPCLSALSLRRRTVTSWWLIAAGRRWPTTRYIPARSCLFSGDGIWWRSCWFSWCSMDSFPCFSLFFMGDLGALWDSLGFRGVRLLDPCGVWIRGFGGFVNLVLGFSGASSVVCDWFGSSLGEPVGFVFVFQFYRIFALMRCGTSGFDGSLMCFWVLFLNCPQFRSRMLCVSILLG